MLNTSTVLSLIVLVSSAAVKRFGLGAPPAGCTCSTASPTPTCLAMKIVHAGRSPRPSSPRTMHSSGTCLPGVDSSCLRPRGLYTGPEAVYALPRRTRQGHHLTAGQRGLLVILDSVITAAFDESPTPAGEHYQSSAVASNVGGSLRQEMTTTLTWTVATFSCLVDVLSSRSVATRCGGRDQESLREMGYLALRS